MFLAEILTISVDDSIINRNGKIMMEKADLITYLHGEYFELGKQTGRMAASILKGEKTALQIPFEIIEGSSLYINNQKMNELGLTLPQELLDRAIEVNNK